MPASFRRFINNLSEQFADILTDSSEDAAEQVRLALQEVIEEIQANSRSGALRGYRAIKEPGDSETLRLRRSGYRLRGQYRWFVFVQAPTRDRRQDFNLFDLLDEGRPELPNDNSRPYPLPGAALNFDGLQQRYPSNARVTGGNPAAGANPLPDNEVGDYRNRAQPNARLDNIRFSFGPIPAVPAKALYDEALRRAQSRLRSRRFIDWEVIKVGT